MSSHQKKDDPKKEEVRIRWCAVCGELLPVDHLGVWCMNSHHLCSECSANYKRSILSAPAPESFPPKCGFCASQLNLPSFERQLDDDECGTYLTFMTMRELSDNEVLHSCPFCPFFCIRVVNKVVEAPFLHCKNPTCQRTSCALCKKECVPIHGGGGEAEREEADESEVLGLKEHFVCIQNESTLGNLRDEVQDAIIRGIMPACPKCKHGGTKDDECTHMTCESCHTVWCYVCGLDVASEDCDKSGGSAAPEYRHNVNWYTKPTRCPMYLSAIHEIDDTWPEDEDAAKAHLHRAVALRNLRRAYDKMGQEQYRNLIAAYPAIGPASGFSEEQIRAVALSKPLFGRVDPDRFGEECEEDLGSQDSPGVDHEASQDGSDDDPASHDSSGADPDIFREESEGDCSGHHHSGDDF